jgi:hypothetical protein
LEAAVRWLDRPGTPGRARDITTLPHALRRFVSHPRPRVLLGTVTSLATVRAVRGGVRRADARVALTCAVAQPFTEWMVHRWLLHARPTGPIGRACYRSFASGHERHHSDPENMDTMFLRPLEVIGAGAVALTIAAAGSPQAGTGALCVGLAAIAYDWTHFLMHTGYRPQSALYRRLWRSHRLHHFRNENYWLGVTSPVADIAFRTNPPRDSVPVSLTAACPSGAPTARAEAGRAMVPRNGRVLERRGGGDSSS